MTRLAVAIRPPAVAVAALAGLDRPAVPGMLWSVPERWVIKLRPLGHVADHLVEPLTEALAAELDGAPSTACTLGPATVRPPGEWLIAPVTGLDELAAAVFDATAAIVPVTHPQPFRAYVVLATGKVPKTVAGAAVAASWVAGEVVLQADRSAPNRPRLVDLARFPLEG